MYVAVYVYPAPTKGAPTIPKAAPAAPAATVDFVPTLSCAANAVASAPPIGVRRGDVTVPRAHTTGESAALMPLCIRVLLSISS